MGSLTLRISSPAPQTSSAVVEDASARGQVGLVRDRRAHAGVALNVNLVAAGH